MRKILVLGEMPEGADPALYMAGGTWCFAGRERLFPDWESRYQFAPEPFQDTGLLPGAAKTAQALCMAAMSEIPQILTPHSDKFPQVYWQTILVPWAIAVASQIVDRWLRVQAMIKLWENEDFLIPLLPAEREFNFKDEHDFNIRGTLGLTYNWWLFSRLLESHLPTNWQKSYSTPPVEKIQNPKANNSTLKNFLRHFILRLPFPVLKGMSLTQSLVFSFALNHKCKIPAQKTRESLFADKSCLAELPKLNNLLAIFKTSLTTDIKALIHQPVKGKKESRLKVGSIIAYENASYRQRLARWKTRGGKLAYSQHGGNYGQARVVCNSPIVEYCEDLFFTWGWKTHGNAWGNFKPMPWPQLQKEKYAWTGGNSIIFVGTEMSCHNYRIESHPTPLQFVQYRQDKARFLKACPPALLPSIQYRPYFPLPGSLEDGPWLLERFPQISLCKGNLLQQALKCKILVLDYPGTIMLEAFAANIPTLLFWNREQWAWTDKSEELLDQLQNVGIWHPTPEAAAKKLAAVISDIKDWWNTSQVRNSVSEYCDLQARTVKSGLNSYWINTLLHL